jgi:hypothetical protein
MELTDNRSKGMRSKTGGLILILSAKEDFIEIVGQSQSMKTHIEAERIGW